MADIVRARRPVRLPVVLSRDEVAALLAELCGPVRLMASLMYGSGLRLLECCELRVKDLSFDRGEITIRDGKGGKDRVTMLPAAVVPRGRGRSRRAPHQAAVSVDRVGVALGVSGHAALFRCRRPGMAATPFARIGRAAGDCRGGTRGGHQPAGHSALAAPFVRHGPARGGLRHPDDSGAAGASRRQHDDDLHARPEPGRPGCTESAGSARRGPAATIVGRRADQFAVLC